MHHLNLNKSGNLKISFVELPIITYSFTIIGVFNLIYSKHVWVHSLFDLATPRRALDNNRWRRVCTDRDVTTLHTGNTDNKCGCLPGRLKIALLLFRAATHLYISAVCSYHTTVHYWLQSQIVVWRLLYNTCSLCYSLVK